ncbi:hypothetical protein POM88_042489 [Heracleum sosnowskyi]|uniref:Uncharacterized protein n=1 Tax=Heracleum sosnowskyi TaxID=360622 RepID=A0AAD8HII3_9APIA|nr:hypothetical protein POM88_042489 [Heracleum sosnowskyi]
MRTKSNQNKLMKFITVPIRVLKKGRDMYVESMMNYAHKPRYTTSTSSSNKGSAKMGQGVSGLPKSFSTSVASTRSTIYDEGDDFRELIRANSTSHTNGSMNLDVEDYVKRLVEEQKLSRQKLYNDHLVENGMKNSKMAKGVPRSYSVGLGRIDEGKACEFDEEEEEEVEDGGKKVPEVMLRSRSHAVGVGNRNSSLVF